MCFHSPDHLPEVALALVGQIEFVLAQNVLVQLHIRAQEHADEMVERIRIVAHLFIQVIVIHIDADSADQSKVLAVNGNRRALKTARPDVQLVVELVRVIEGAAAQVHHKIGRRRLHVTSGDVVLEHVQRLRWVGQIVQEDLDADVRKAVTDQPHNALVVFEVAPGVIEDFIAFVFGIQLEVFLALPAREDFADVVLLADNDQLARCEVISLLTDGVDGFGEFFQVEKEVIVLIQSEWVVLMLLDGRAFALLSLSPLTDAVTDSQRQQ